MSAGVPKRSIAIVALDASISAGLRDAVTRGVSMSPAASVTTRTAGAHSNAIARVRRASAALADE